MAAAKRHALVELNAEPAKRLNDIFLGSGNKASGVGVFYAKNEFAPMLAGKKIVIKRRAHAANMEGSGGTGSKAHANLRFFHF